MVRALACRLGLIWTTCIVLAGTPATPVLADDDSDLRSYYSGNGFLNRQLYDLAAEEYRTFLREHPRHEKADVARYGLAVSLFNLEQFEEAQTHLTRLHGQPEFPYAVEVTMVLGQCHLARKQFQEAAATFEEVLDRHRDHDLADDAAALQAEALYQSGEYRRVAGPCERLVEQWPRSPHRERVELLWGLSDMAQELFGAAAERFERMQMLFPDGAYADQASLLMAQSLHRAESFRRAETQYRQVIQDASDAFVPDALYGLASLLQTQGEPKEAGELLDRLLRGHPDHALVLPATFLRGRASFDQEQYEQAMSFLNTVHESAGAQADEAAYWLAKCELRLDEPGAAADRLETAIAQYPQSVLRPEMIYDRGVALVRAGRPSDALAMLEGFRLAYGDHPLAADSLHLIVLTEHQEARYDKSLEQCRVFAAEHADHRHAAAVAFVAAENLFLMERFEAATDAYRDFLDRFPRDEQVDKARYRLGMAFYHRELFEESRPLLASVSDGAATAPLFRPAVLALGDGAFQQGRWVEAQSHLENYLAIGTDQPAADDALLKLGLARQRQDDFGGALEAYDQLLATFPESQHRLQTLFERGQSLVASGRQDEAVDSFEALLADGPDSSFAPHALNHLAAIAVERDELDRAATLYARVVAFDPSGALADEAAFQQAQTLMADGRFAEADAIFATIVREYPQSQRMPQAAALEAIALARQDRHEDALDRIKLVERSHLAKLDPSLAASVRYEKAWCERGLDRPEDAAVTYRELIASPEHGRLRLYGMLELAELQMDAKRYEQAIAHLRQLEESGRSEEIPGDLREQSAYQMGVCHYQLDDHETASRLLESFLDTYPASDLKPSASLLCGEALFNIGRHERAVERLQPVLDEHQDDDAYGPSLLRAGECLAVLQEWDRSESTFETYLERFPDSAVSYQAQFGIGWARENRGEPEEAIEAYRVVVDRHEGPTAARAQFQIGECLFARKQYQEAARELLKVDILYAYPQWSAAAIYEAGRCFEELSNPVDARRHFQQVIDQYADTTWAKLAAQRLDTLAQTGLPGQPSR